jgi:cGMP-dependent protein kinase
VIKEKYSANQYIYHEGDVASSVYIVQSGQVAWIMDGKEVMRMNPGEHFGFGSIVGQSQKRIATFQATTDVNLTMKFLIM